jgi:hypothetical protein
MLSFLNGGILIALLAVAIPLLIHLINRQNQIKIKFSTLRFLKTIEEKRIKKIKIYQLLLILLRSLIILFLVLSFARPALKSKSTLAGSAAGRTAVIILDNGINMQAYDKTGSRFKRAKDKITLIRHQFNKNDNVLIFPAQQPEKILTDSIQLAALPFSYCGADWNRSLKIAREYFQARPNYNRDLFIISDFQFHEPAFESALHELKDIKIYLVIIGNQGINNVSIDTLLIKNKFFEAGQTLNLDVSVHNSSPVPNDNTELHLFIDKQRIAYQKFNLQGFEKKSIAMACQLKANPKMEGYVELSDDDLAGDNRYYFALTLPDSIRVLYVDEKNSPYLDAAFNSIETNTNLRFTREKYTSWAGKRFEQFQVLFLSNLVTVPAVLISRLNTFLEQGGSLILLPGDGTDLSEFNKICVKLNLAFYLSERTEASAAGDYYSLKSGDWQQPIFSDIFRNVKTDLSNPVFSKYFKVVPGKNNDVLISFNTGDPFILSVSDQQRSVFLICSYIDDSWTDFQYKGTFLPLLLRILLLGATNADQLNQSVTIGQAATFRFKLPENYKELYLKSADSEKIKILTALNQNGIVLDPYSIQVPGNYKLSGETDELSTVSVNAGTRNLLPPYPDLPDLAKGLPNSQLIHEDDDLAELIRENRSGIELFNMLIFLVIITLCIEIALIKSIEGTKFL